MPFYKVAREGLMTSGDLKGIKETGRQVCERAFQAEKGRSQGGRAWWV